MASHPPAHCCTTGHLHEGSTVGEDTKIGNTLVYIAHTPDKSTEHGILILPDGFGLSHKTTATRLLADQFAANGYFTLVVDTFQEDPFPYPAPATYDFQAWINGPPSKLPDAVDPIVTSAIKEMRNKYNVKKLGLVGYCFGGKYVARFIGATGAENNAQADAGFTAHPSFMSEDELKAARAPFSIAAAEVDQVFPEERRHASEAILKELSLGEAKLPWQLTLYSGVSHGFGVRADLNDKRQKFVKEQAFKQAVDWFDYYVKGKGQ